MRCGDKQASTPGRWRVKASVRLWASTVTAMMAKRPTPRASTLAAVRTGMKRRNWHQDLHVGRVSHGTGEGWPPLGGGGGHGRRRGWCPPPRPGAGACPASGPGRRPAARKQIAEESGRAHASVEAESMGWGKRAAPRRGKAHRLLPGPLRAQSRADGTHKQICRREARRGPLCRPAAGDSALSDTEESSFAVRGRGGCCPTFSSLADAAVGGADGGGPRRVRGGRG